MIELHINNSYSQIKGLTAEQFRELRKVLSYKSNPQAAYFSGGYNYSRYLLDKKGFFPTGLMPLVYNQYDSIRTIDHRKVPSLVTTSKKLFEMILGNPYKWQLEAADRAVRLHRGGIVATTGSGKSLLIALIIARLQVRTLVVVPNLEIQKQLESSLIALFGQTSNIVVLNIDSPRLDKETNFDCLMIDECHHVAAKTYQRLNKTAWTNIYYRFFLSATFFRNQENEHLLFEGIAGQVIYELPYKKAVAEGYVVPVEAYYVDLPKKSMDGCYTWRQVYSSMVVHNEERNWTIAALLARLQAAGCSTLCLVKEIAHGEALSTLTNVPFVNGQDDNSRSLVQKFNDRSINTLIGTTGILGEGVDTKPCEYVIIAGLGKAKSAFMQNVGRAVRKNFGKTSAKVIIFRDASHKWGLSHFNAQKKILLDVYGVKTLKLDV